MVFGRDSMSAGNEKSGDLYAVLGLKKECSAADLRNAYKKLAMRWHPDRCSSSGSSKFVEEAKEKFQEIQEAYSVLSDSNKRFLYDVGIYDSDDDDNGMGDFLGEMAQMMSQTKPSENGQESFEELQQLFVDMFHADLDLGPQGPKPKNEAYGHDCSSATSPPNGAPSSNGGNKRGSSGKARLDELDSFSSSGFCFGSNDAAVSSKGRGGGGGGGGGGSSKRRSGRKQKVSSRHDVSSRDAEIST